MSDFFITDYDVTIDICGKYTESYIISAQAESEASILAKCAILNEIKVISVEDMNADNYGVKNPYPKFKHYILNHIDADGNVWAVLENRDLSYLMKIAEDISLPNTDRIEIIGTNEPVDEYKSWSVIFTREL